MGILLGLAAALLYGGSDFAGGLAARRLGPAAGQHRRLGRRHRAGLGRARRVRRPRGRACGPSPGDWPAALAGGTGTLVLYRGLARGQMSVVGPVSAVGAAVFPVLAGVALGERPGLLAVAGVLVALPAIVLVAGGGSLRARLGRGLLGGGVLEGVAAGLAFGILFIGLAQAGRNAGLWPVASEQTGTLLPALLVAVKSRAPLRIPVRAAGLPVLAGPAAWPPRWPTSTPRTSACWPSPPSRLPVPGRHRPAGPGPAARAVQPGSAGRPGPVRPGRRRHRPELT